MSVWFKLALLSAWSRRLAVGLVVASLGLACALVLTVQQLRTDSRQSFSQAVSGVDLIVGPRGSATEILLYSVFQLGRPTANMSAKVLPELRALPLVRWAVPIQLGDSYQGFPVWGTEAEFFQRFQVHGQALGFKEGQAFDSNGLYQVVLGAEVARRLNHKLGDALVVTHGSGQALDKSHDDAPFTLVGILQPTGGSVDRAVLVSVSSYEALHHGWGVGEFQGLRLGSFSGAGQKPSFKDLQPREYTAVLVGLHSRAQVFSARRAIEQLPGAPFNSGAARRGPRRPLALAFAGGRYLAYYWLCGGHHRHVVGCGGYAGGLGGTTSGAFNSSCPWRLALCGLWSALS